MSKKETSAHVSLLASSYIKTTAEDLWANYNEAGTFETEKSFWEDLTADIRTLAASCLSQDETSDNS